MFPYHQHSKGSQMTSIDTAEPPAASPAISLRGPDLRDRGLIRELNDWIAGRRPPGMFIEFACECRLRGCVDTISLGCDEYERVRRSPGQFAVAPGHVVPMHERVVELNARYAVVEQHDA